LSAGSLEEDMADIALANSDNDEFVAHRCNAINWYKATTEASCTRIVDQETRIDCENVLPNNAWAAAQNRLNSIPNSYDRNCR
jgi:hypothetical protein